MKSCADCRFFQAGDPDGVCRRYPPMGEPPVFPGTMGTNWCGEYRPVDGGSEPIPKVNPDKKKLIGE
ncbi:MAG: hypothetical protein QNJ62_06245 [Methyloceanibacter sp.]|nr:hypothetical protein [Methyloceanibacter sp.]